MAPLGHHTGVYHLIELPFESLIDDAMFVCLLDELILGFCYSDLTLETVGFELASTITLVLQANRLAKCADNLVLFSVAIHKSRGEKANREKLSIDPQRCNFNFFDVTLCYLIAGREHQFLGKIATHFTHFHLLIPRSK